MFLGMVNLNVWVVSVLFILVFLKVNKDCWLEVFNIVSDVRFCFLVLKVIFNFLIWFLMFLFGVILKFVFVVIIWYFVYCLGFFEVNNINGVELIRLWVFIMVICLVKLLK